MREDHSLWELLLRIAVEHPLAHGEPWQSLRTFRCLGARLTWDGKRLTMGPSEEYPKTEYKVDREQYLFPIQYQLGIIFAEASKTLAKGGR